MVYIKVIHVDIVIIRSAQSANKGSILHAEWVETYILSSNKDLYSTIRETDHPRSKTQDLFVHHVEIVYFLSRVFILALLFQCMQQNQRTRGHLIGPEQTDEAGN